MAPTHAPSPHDNKSEYEPPVRIQPLTPDEQLARDMVEGARKNGDPWLVQLGSDGSALSRPAPCFAWPTTPNFGRRTYDFDWTNEAACAGLTGLFFSDDKDDVAASAGICTGCPVVAHCAEWRDRVNPCHGVWSGERRRPKVYGTTPRPNPRTG